MHTTLSANQPIPAFRRHSSRLTLRPLQAADLAVFAAYRANAEVARFQSWEPYSLAQSTEFMATHSQAPVPATPGQWVQIAIADQATDQLLGDCALHLFANEPRIAEIGITLAPAAQGQGYAHEALVCLLQYCFLDLHLHRVVAVADGLNTAVSRLLQRVGMRREARFKQNVWFKGAWGDEDAYALLRTEWLSRPAAGGEVL